MRLFIAVPASPDVRRWLTELLAELRGLGADCKWSSTDDAHWTLHFFGETASERLASIRGVVDATASSAGPFELTPGGLGAFPDAASPKVVWAGLKRGGAELKALAARLGEALKGEGFPLQDREFRAHLTLGRVRGSRGLESLQAALAKPRADGPAMRAESLVLYQSLLKPSGAVHEPLHEARLSA